MTVHRKNGQATGAEPQARPLPRSPQPDRRRDARGTGAADWSATLSRALAEISQLALTSEPDALFPEAADIVATVLQADTIGVFELSDDAKVLRLVAGCGWPAGALQRKPVPVGVSRPLREALSAEDAVAFDGAELGSLLRGHAPDGVGLAVPMGARGARAGVLIACGGGAVRPEQENAGRFLKTAASILAAAWERKRTDAVLNLRNQALEALDQGIMITDAQRLDNPIIYVNPAFERLTGYAAGSVLGKNPRFLQGPATSPDIVRKLRETVGAGRVFHDTIVNYGRHRDEFWNELTISPVHGAEGGTTHYVGIMNNVSARVRLEAQLRQAQKMEAIGHLTGGIAHDFNNLLAVVLGNLEALLDDADDEEFRKTIELVMQTAERGAVLTQRLLAFGRRQTLRPEPLEIAAALESMADMLQRTLGEQVSLVCGNAARGKCAMVDRSLFESAILNLAVNARDAMPDGGELAIDAEMVTTGDSDLPEELAEGDFLKVEVRDTGIGMTAEVIKQAFEPFFTTKDVGRGSGLGLAMVYGFAQQSGGTVTIDSSPGKGTTVDLFLPKADVPAHSPLRVIAAKAPMPHGSERILLVEDEAEVRRFVAQLLQRLGYSVIEAADASSALDVLGTVNRIDLLFSDLILPGGTNGLGLVEKARAIQPDLRVLLTTGYTEEYERLSESSPGRILKKPYRRRELANLLRETLDAA